MQIGVYQGHYQYEGKRLPAFLQDRQTKFEIRIGQVNEGKFSGTVREDEKSGGMPDQGTVRGEIAGEKINFTKQMPRLAMFVGKDKIKMFRQPHPPIYYQGEKKGEGHYAGTWQLKVRFRIWGMIRIPLGSSRGIWEMKNGAETGQHEEA